MGVFRDKLGEEWRIVFDLVTTKHVKDTLQIDLLDIGNSEAPLITLASNPLRAAEVLFRLCETEIAEKKLSAEDFMKRLTGDVIENACEVLWTEAVDFFPSSRRQQLTAAINHLRTARKISTEAALKGLELPELEGAMSRKANQMVEQFRRDLLKELETESVA